MPNIRENRRRAAVLALIAIAMATTQDAIVKSMSGTYPAYETVIIRCVSSLPLLLGWLLATQGMAALRTPQWPLVLLRSLILCSAYFAFILAISAMPMANAISIYFTMPFFVAGLAGPLLHERVPIYRVVAIIIGFIGVLIMERPGWVTFEPAALLALYSAAGYAVGQMLGRKLSDDVAPVVIANYPERYLSGCRISDGFHHRVLRPARGNEQESCLSHPPHGVADTLGFWRARRHGHFRGPCHGLLHHRLQPRRIKLRGAV